MKLNWGNQNQLIFDSEEEYYMALGIFSNPKLARIYIEDNAKRGSFTDASRLHLYAETQRANLHVLPLLQALLRAVQPFRCLRP